MQTRNLKRTLLFVGTLLETLLLGSVGVVAKADINTSSKTTQELLETPYIREVINIDFFDVDTTTTYDLATTELQTDLSMEIVAETVIEEIKEEEIIEPVVIQPTMEDILGYKVSADERDLLARLVFREGGNTPLIEQEMIVMVVLNRLATDKYSTINEVIFAPGQFSTAYTLKSATPTEENYQAVDLALNGDIADFPCKYFWGDGRRNHFRIEYGDREYHYTQN